MCGIFIEPEEGGTMHIVGQANGWDNTVLHREIEHLKEQLENERERRRGWEERSQHQANELSTTKNCCEQQHIEIQGLQDQIAQASTMLSLLIGSVGYVKSEDMFKLLYWQLVKVRETLTIDAEQPF
jgi:hypothetical protein